MCRDKEHGGVRCPADNSAARRRRRKASAVRANAAKITPTKTSKPLKPAVAASIEEFKARAEELRNKAYAPVPEGMSQAEYDAEVEKEITALGMAMISQADKMSGFSIKTVEKKIDAVADKLYTNINQKMKEHESEFDEAWDEWDKVLSELDEAWDNRGETSEEQLDSLSFEQQTAYARLTNAKYYQKKLRDEYKAVDAQYDVEVAEIREKANRKLTTAYQTLIAGIRPVGGEVSKGEGGERVAEDIIDKTVGQHYPKAWLDKHNNENGSEVIFTTDGNRANYNRLKLSETEDDGIPKTIPSGYYLDARNEDIKPVLDQMFKNKPKTLEWEHGFLGTQKSLYYTYDEEELYIPENNGGSATPPENEGWEYRVTPLSGSMLGEAEDKNEDLAIFKAKRWVRTKYTTKKRIKTLSVFSEEAAEDIGKRTKASSNYNEAIAYHEFGHRMEEVLPNNILPRQEKAFLMRRTGKTEENFHTGMTSTGNNLEFGHKGDFVDLYVGRDYFNDKSFEVFTTGIESLYGGSFGGLVGNSINHRKNDNDHRAFTLGVLATL